MVKICALGPAGTNGHEAAKMASEMLKLGQDGADQVTEISFCSRNDEILERVGRDKCFGVVPIENSSAGLVSEVVRFWLKWAEVWLDLNVIGEILLPIEHHLLVHPSIQQVEELSGVMSHPQALAQCAKSLDRLGLKTRIPSASTAGAAAEVATNSASRSVGAIASRLAGELNGLRVISQHIEDCSGNATRFHLVARRTLPSPTGNDRTAIIFCVPNRPRALLNPLWCIGTEEVNMSSIHSIPLGTPSEYAFYCELDCHSGDRKGVMILERMRTFTNKIIVLGSYPQNSELPKGV